MGKEMQTATQVTPGTMHRGFTGMHCNCFPYITENALQHFQ